MLRLGNGLILAGVMGLVLVGAPYAWVIPGMAGAFFIGFLFPVVQ